MKLGLFPKMLLGILAPAMLGLLCLTGISSTLADHFLRQRVDEEMYLAVDSQLRELTIMTNLLRASLRIEGGMAIIVNFLESTSGKGEADQAAAEAVQRKLAEFVAFYNLVTDVELLDTKGVILSGSDTEHVGKSLAANDFFRKALEGGFGAENRKGEDGKPESIMAVGIQNGQGKTIGVLVATLNMEAIGSESTDKITLSRTGICMIYDGTGLLHMHPNLDILPRLKSGDSQRRQSCDCIPERVPASTRLPRGTRLGFRRKHSHVGNFTGTNQPPIPPGLTISPQADTACPAAVSPVSTLKAERQKFQSRCALYPRPEGRGFTARWVTTQYTAAQAAKNPPTVPPAHTAEPHAQTIAAHA